MASVKHIEDMAIEIFGDSNKAKLWMDTPIPALDLNTPASLLTSETDLKRVMELLNKIKYGEFT